MSQARTELRSRRRQARGRHRCGAARDVQARRNTGSQTDGADGGQHGQTLQDWTEGGEAIGRHRLRSACHRTRRRHRCRGHHRDRIPVREPLNHDLADVAAVLVAARDLADVRDVGSVDRADISRSGAEPRKVGFMRPERRPRDQARALKKADQGRRVGRMPRCAEGTRYPGPPAAQPSPTPVVKRHEPQGSASIHVQPQAPM